MTLSAQNQLVSDLSRDLITEIAPQELPLFRLTSTAYFADPRKALQARQRGDKILGFGAGEAAVFLTPVALVVMSRVVDFLLDVLKDFIKGAAEAAGDTIVKTLAERMIKKPTPGTEVGVSVMINLTPEQRLQVRELARKTCLEYNLTEEQAERVAGRVVGVLPAPAEGPHEY